MIALEEIKKLAISSPSKIVMLVIDGLGGLPDPKTWETEIDIAFTPNLDNLAREGVCGLIDPVSPGITPGSGPGHLALFGYDPLRFTIGRGILEALGIDFEIEEGDIAARGNFCTIDEKGLITDRRAGRISTGDCAELCTLLDKIKLPDVQLFVLPIKEHRFLMVLRGKDLSPAITDTDPQKPGFAPVTTVETEPQARHTAYLVNRFTNEAREILASQYQTNMLLLRGFSKLPVLPSMNEIYKLSPAGIVEYPMYKGLAKLVGMKTFQASNGIRDELAIVANRYAEHDFFYVHFKKTDSAGEDGDFERKIQYIEEIDALLPQILDLSPEVMIVTGDHSTPSLLKGHSWHPVPLLIKSQWCRPDQVLAFSETACVSGGLGRFPAVELMPLAMANALKLNKFGA